MIRSSYVLKNKPFLAFTITSGCSIVVSLIIFLRLDTFSYRDLPKSRSLLKNETTEKSEPNVKLILLYTTFFKGPWLDHPILGALRPPMLPGKLAFEGCDVPFCYVTNDRSLLSHADAVGFHGRDILKNESLPIRQEANQIWFYYVMENPMNMVNLSAFKNVFNWTMSYRRDSEIHIPYGRYAQLEPGDKVETVDLGMKDMLVAWMVSNCREKERNLYVRQLRSFMRVDVYGLCGTFRCQKPQRSDECRRLLRRYKFYLAFENGNCRDYITEKYWDNTLDNDIIPIVMGGADYCNPELAIPNSYIDVSDFSSPKELAEYLLYLDMNDTAYMEYFKWRTKYKLVAPKRACTLCKALHNKDLYDPPRIIQDMRDTWSNSDCKTLKLVKEDSVILRPPVYPDVLTWILSNLTEVPLIDFGNIKDQFTEIRDN